MKQYKNMAVGTLFTTDEVHGTYVKLGQHGARKCNNFRIQKDKHYIPALRKRCKIVGHIAEGLR